MNEWSDFVRRLDQKAGGFALAGLLDELEAAMLHGHEGLPASSLAELASALGRAATRTNDPYAICRCLMMAKDLDEVASREYAESVLAVVVGGLKSHASCMFSLLCVLDDIKGSGSAIEVEKNLALAESRLAKDDIHIPW